MKRIIIMGSPRSNGRSAHLAEMLFEANIDERPEDELFLVPISEIEVGPCIACNACREQMEIISRDARGNETRELRHRCVFDDDMQALYDLIDDADELTVVTPVFFSGSPASLKALLDRLQPYFWENVRAREKGMKREKRPATLHVIGEGGDPHGYDALVSEVKSALAVAEFRLERIFDWVGKIDETGEITADAEETVLEKQETPKPPATAISETPSIKTANNPTIEPANNPASGPGNNPAIGTGETTYSGTGNNPAIGTGETTYSETDEKSGRGALRAPAEQCDNPGSQNPPTGKTPHSAKPRPKLDLSAAGKQQSKRNKGKANRRG